MLIVTTVYAFEMLCGMPAAAQGRRVVAKLIHRERVERRVAC